MTGVLRVGARIDGGRWTIDRCYAYDFVVEAVGHDWVVLRCNNRDLHLFTGDPDSLTEYVYVD